MFGVRMTELLCVAMVVLLECHVITKMHERYPPTGLREEMQGEIDKRDKCIKSLIDHQRYLDELLTLTPMPSTPTVSPVIGRSAYHHKDKSLMIFKSYDGPSFKPRAAIGVGRECEPDKAPPNMGKAD